MGVFRRTRVVDRDGVNRRLVRIDATDPDHPLAVIELRRGAHVRIPFERLHHGRDGGYAIAARWAEIPLERGDGISIPVIEERLTVAVRPAAPQSVRVRRRVVSEHREVEVPFWNEHVDVQRVPVDTFVDRAPAARYEGDTLIIPCVEQVPVVEVRLRVREELHIKVVREQRVHRETVALRRHDIDIESTTPPDERRDTEGEEV